MSTRKRQKKAGSLEASVYLERRVGPLTLGKALRATREGEGMSQVDFARRLKVSKQHLCDIELGRKAVSPARAAEFARVLGYSERQYVCLALQDELHRAGLRYHVEVSAA